MPKPELKCRIWRLHDPPPQTAQLHDLAPTVGTGLKPCAGEQCVLVESTRLKILHWTLNPVHQSDVLQIEFYSFTNWSIYSIPSKHLKTWCSLLYLSHAYTLCLCTFWWVFVRLNRSSKKNWKVSVLKEVNVSHEIINIPSSLVLTLAAELSGPGPTSVWALTHTKYSIHFSRSSKM